MVWGCIDYLENPPGSIFVVVVFAGVAQPEVGWGGEHLENPPGSYGLRVAFVGVERQTRAECD